MPATLHAPTWMKHVLRLAGLYNLAWGAVVIGLPGFTLSAIGLAPATSTLWIWQCLGMVVGVYGIGYLIAARDPFRHWPIVLIGLLGKVFGPLGFVWGYLSGDLSAQMGWMLLGNDLIWWWPFAAMLWSAFRFHQVSGTVYAAELLIDDPVRELRTQNGESLAELSHAQPQLIVLLRHSGCTFCRQALAELARQRSAIEELGGGIVLVHPGGDNEILPLLGKHGLETLPRISDPQCRLYRQFGLEQGRLSQLLGWRVWWRAMKAGLIEGHGIGSIAGNPFQMPGVFVIHGEQALCGFQHDSAAENPDYTQLVQHALKSETAPVSV
jgi:peroxiredoxin